MNSNEIQKAIGAGLVTASIFFALLYIYLPFLVAVCNLVNCQR